MMKSRLLLLSLVISLLIVNQAISQKKGSNSITKRMIIGKLIDKESQSPLASASVSLHSIIDSSIITGAISDREGKFEINEVKNGKYYLRINFIGYQPKKINNILVNDDNFHINLGKIEITQGSAEMPEIQVMAEKPMIEYSSGKKIINVDKNIASAGGNALDVLKNVPSVNVDVDGNVSVRGSQNVNILINGKPSTLTATGSTILEQIPANVIDHLEIVTNPSAKYEAEGNAGIINIVLKKEKDPGLNGVISANAGTLDRYSSSVSLNYNFSGINLFGSYDFSSFHGGMDGSSYRQISVQDTTTYMNQAITRRRFSLSHNAKAGFDIQFDKQNSYTFTSVYRWRNNDNTGLTNTNSTILANIPKELSIRSNDEREKSPSLDLSMNYKHLFPNKGHELNVDAFYSNSNDDENTDFLQNYTLPIEPVLKQNSDNLEKNTNINLQADYVLPIGLNGKLEAGFKNSRKRMDADYQFSNFSSSLNSYLLDSSRSNHYVFDEIIYAGYAIYSNKWDDLQYSLGLRLEQTNTKGDQRTTNQIYQQNYLDLFPSLNLSYKLSESQEFQFNYSRRINRPRAYSTNPFIDYSDMYSLRYGNPQLKPEYVNSLELGFLQNITPKFTVTPAIFYRHTTDVMDRFTVLLNNGIFGMTWENMAKSYSYGLEFTFAGEILSWLKTNGDVSYYKYVIYGNPNYSGGMNEDYSWNGRLTLNFVPMKELNFQLSGNYSAPSVTSQGKRYETYSMDFGGRWDVLDNLTLSLRASDIFHTGRFRVSASGIGFFTDFNMLRMSQAVSLGLQFKINGGIKQKERKKNGGDGGGMDEFD